jgi:hypothetical protein
VPSLRVNLTADFVWELQRELPELSLLLYFTSYWWPEVARQPTIQINHRESAWLSIKDWRHRVGYIFHINSTSPLTFNDTYITFFTALARRPTVETLYRVRLSWVGSVLRFFLSKKFIAE